MQFLWPVGTHQKLYTNNADDKNTGTDIFILFMNAVHVHTFKIQEIIIIYNTHAWNILWDQAGDNGDIRTAMHPVTRQNKSHAMKISVCHSFVQIENELSEINKP